MSDTPKKFYLTTPIYYVNARPHIGHAYSTIAADVIARRHRLLGEDTFFLTGTDEHGQKVQRSAEKAGVPPQQFTDEVSATFQNLWKRMGITNDDYIRTTDPRHKRGVQKLWRTLEERGAIYLSSYTGQYCVSEEMFVDGPPGTIGPDGKPTETVTEENYFFKLSDYQEKLINLIESGTLHIQPEAIRNEVLSFLRGNVDSVMGARQDELIRGAVQQDERQHLPEAERARLIQRERRWDIEASDSCKDDGTLAASTKGVPYVPGALKDLSISRTSFTWGIPVPGNEKHVIYVWLDALANYITAIGYGSDDPADQAKFAKYWPADLHLVGKEITRFHCVYWPAFLMALRPPEIAEAEWNAKWIPKSVVANGWLLFEESKMSKSRGNVVRTETILDAFGPLCPSTANNPVAPTSEAVILSAAKDPEALDATTSARTVLPQNSADLTPPIKAQQDLFASDVIRYFLLREIPFGQDGSFSFDALITRYNADLTNGLGNQVSRVLTMIRNNFDSVVPSPMVGSEIEVNAKRIVFGGGVGPIRDTPRGLEAPEMADISCVWPNDDSVPAFAQLLSSISTAEKALDFLLTEIKPWSLTEDPSKREELATTLYVAAECIRWFTALRYPVMPYATASVWSQLGLGSIEEAAANGELKNLQWGGLKPGTKLGTLAPIFPRAEKGLAQIMTDMENPTPEPVSAPSGPTPEALNAVHPPATEAPAAQVVPDTPQIAIDDFVKVDLRVAQILVAERIPKADKLLRLEVDLGYERRQILSGIAEWYTPEELIGRRIAVIANLAPRKMRGLESHGMLLAASADDHASKPILASFSDEVPLGSRIR